MEQQREEGNVEDELRELADGIYNFHMENNGECEAIDLALEAGEIDLIGGYVTEINYKKTGLYISSIARYLKEEVRVDAMETLYSSYISFEDWPRALQIALFLDNFEDVGGLFRPHHDLLIQKQLCYIIARQGVTFVLDEKMTENDDDRKALQFLINNGHLSEWYRTLTLARDVDGKSSEDIYEAELLPHRGKAGASLESSLQTLAATFANAFGNAGCGKDNLMTVPSEASGSWVFKNYEHRKASAAASLGMILMWDVDSGLAQLDKYLHSDDNHAIAGALLGVGVLTCSVKLDPHPASLLVDYVKNEDSSIRIAAILGLGLAHAGSQCPQIRSILSPILKPRNQASKATFEVIAFTALALGLVYVGSCEKDVAEEISFAISWQSETDLEKPFGRILVLGHGLLYLGKEDSADAILEVSGRLNVNQTLKNYFNTTLFSCAFAGSGNVHQVHHFLRCCRPHLEREGDYQASAVIGIAMVAMGNELGLEMAIRLFQHLLCYGEVNIRRAVPLALGLLCISNPKVNVMDTLSRLSHDEDEDVAMAAIISLGLIGAGTNNAKIAGMLRSLSHLSASSEAALFCIQVAQGLMHLGKGLLTMAPYHSGRFLLSRTALAGIITVLHACLDMKSFMLGNYQFLLYFLALAMRPSMLMTVNENLKPVSVPVRVGKVVDVATVADQSNTISQLTPVVLAAGERAELDTEKMEKPINVEHQQEACELATAHGISSLLNAVQIFPVRKVEDALEIKGSDLSDSSGIVVEDYQLIVDCTALLVDIENEIFLIHNFIRDNYRLKFPELQSLVHHPIDYARVVKKIGNEMDLTRVNLDGLLPSAIIMVDSIAATTTSGKPLPEQILRKTIEACDRALALHSAKKTALDFLETRMGHIAPNLSAILGSAVAAKLVVTAGGLSALANIPACTVRLLGANETYQFCVGYIEQTEISQSTPPSLRMRACRLLAAKSTVAARIDSISEYPTGDHGRAVRDKIHKIIAEWQEPPSAKRRTSLPPVPDCKPKKESDGRRCKKMKLSCAMTDQRKMANSMQFGVFE
ncbi:hypothetical protein Vadar_018571 [Vaccinium darrowii]|uniref:Uncharacterized protein n=1 Tax=Vaccinium darrowii TaxID=229202 RepID=A0ACB7Y7I2_9ERIC|nr:hypothetical protein Vadar_018571 [Vaccinium darrowii]